MDSNEVIELLLALKIPAIRPEVEIITPFSIDAEFGVGRVMLS